MLRPRTSFIPFLVTASIVLECTSQRTRLSRGMEDSVSRAIEMTKRRQSADREAPSSLTVSAAKSKSSRPPRTEELDVQRLNLLIKTIDKAWAMPKLNSKEPVGSNFQYKKTCANIFKARHQACQQPGFGIMCFNFCYEQGESLIFKCEDTSDASYCKSNAHYDDFLTKYRKDAYRAKAYIHQMISRCYSSSVCSAEGLLNSSLTLGSKGAAFAAKQPPSLKKHPSRTTINVSRSGRRKKPQQIGQRLTSHEEASREDGESMDEREPVTPKYVPFWQRLLSRKTTSRPGKAITTTSASPSITPTIFDVSAEPDELDLVDSTPAGSEKRPDFQPRYTTSQKLGKWKPVRLVSTALSPYKSSDKHSNNKFGGGETVELESAAPFWNKFQPGRWYQSIHYITPTG